MQTCERWHCNDGASTRALDITNNIGSTANRSVYFQGYQSPAGNKLVAKTVSQGTACDGIKVQLYRPGETTPVDVIRFVHMGDLQLNKQFDTNTFGWTFFYVGKVLASNADPDCQVGSQTHYQASVTSGCSQNSYCVISPMGSWSTKWLHKVPH